VAQLERGTWTPAAVFAVVGQRGKVDRAELEKTFNMGVGMVAVVPPEDVDRALAMLTARHVPAWILGDVRPAEDADGPRAVLSGDHPRF
jgi:phosphoribosylformylglycinamidine cyclo-ligase